MSKIRCCSLVILIALGASRAQAGEPTQADINICAENADCIVVPYKHCCGSTKRAINKKHKKLYESKKDWQIYKEENCKLMGACFPDGNVKSAVCNSEKRCELKF